MAFEHSHTIEQAHTIRSVSESEATPPIRPLHFDRRYTLPVHQEKRLQHQNCHEHDRNIHFYEKPHVYAVNGRAVDTSVSSLAHDYIKPFDGHDAIGAMRSSKSQAWPRLQYVFNPILVTVDTMSPTAGCLLVHRTYGKTIAATQPFSFRNKTGPEMALILQALNIDPVANLGMCDYYNFDAEMREEDILKYWDDNAENARNRGTEAHLQMELWLNSMPVRYDDPEVLIGLEFIASKLSTLGATAYRTEWEIYAPDEDVAGSIDFVARLPCGGVLLIDWKRSEKLKDKMTGYGRMKPPLHHLDDCSGSAYALQLSSYQYIMEKYYNLKVKGRILVNIHPDAPFHSWVPYLWDEVSFLMLQRRERKLAREHIEKLSEHTSLLCSVSGRLATNAVRDEMGKLYYEKEALILNRTTTPCSVTSTECNRLIAAHAQHPVYGGNSTPWKRTMKAGGLRRILD